MKASERIERMAEELLEAHSKDFQAQLTVAVGFAFDEGVRRCEYDYPDNHYTAGPWLSVLSGILAPTLLAAERQGYEAYPPLKEPKKT